MAQVALSLQNCTMSIASAAAERSAATVSTDRRQSGGLKVDSNAVVTVLGVDISFDGMLMSVSDCGAQLKLDRRIDLSAPVKIECTDFLLLGEVAYCQAEQGNWIVGVNVEQGLYGLKALADAIRESWLE